MTTNELNGMRWLWEMLREDGYYVTPVYDLIDAQGRVVMFGLTRERAEGYAKFYPGSRVVESK